MTDQYIPQGINYRLLRRVQHDKMEEIARGIDRNISLIPAIEHAPDKQVLATAQTLENRWERIESRIERKIYRPLRDISPWCYKCSKKHNKQVRTAECECE